MENVEGNNLDVAPEDEGAIENFATDGFNAGQIIGCFETAREGPGQHEGVECWKVEGNIDKYLGCRLEIHYKRPDDFFISNYPAFRLRRQECFYRYLIQDQYFQKALEGRYSSPDFVCERSVLKRLFMIPMTTMFREFYARRFQGVIFIEQPNTGYRGRTDERSHQGAVYARRVTGQKVLRCFDEHVVKRLIREVVFRPNDNNDTAFRLLTTDDAYVNQTGEGILIRAINSRRWNPDDLLGVERRTLTEKYLKYYRNMAVIGAQELILGHRDDKGVLQKNERLHIDEVWGRTAAPERGREKCHEFLGRLLQWLKQQFQDNDDEESKMIKFCPEEIESESEHPRRVVVSEDITEQRDNPSFAWRVIDEDGGIF